MFRRMVVCALFASLTSPRGRRLGQINALHSLVPDVQPGFPDPVAILQFCLHIFVSSGFYNVKPKRVPLCFQLHCNVVIMALAFVHKGLYPYPASAGSATAAGGRRTRLAPPGMVPAVSGS